VSLTAGTVRLARALLERAITVLRRLRSGDTDGQRAALEALEPFLGEPRPVTYLTSCRQLLALSARGGEAMVARSRARGVDRSLAVLRALPGVPAELVDRLVVAPGDLPGGGEPADGIDPGTGERLRVLEALLLAHQELASRAEAASSRLRQSLHVPSPAQRRPRTVKPAERRPARGMARTPVRKSSSSGV
jgi:hypothetical protein